MKMYLGRIASFLVFISCMLLVAQASAEPLAVIVNKDNPVNDLSLLEIKMIYHDETTQWPGGEKITVYDLSLKSQERARFSEAVIGKSPNEVEAEWANKTITNTAKNQPVTLKSKALVLYKIKKDKNAIGYVPISMIKGRPSITQVATVD